MYIAVSEELIIEPMNAVDRKPWDGVSVADLKE